MSYWGTTISTSGLVHTIPTLSYVSVSMCLSFFITSLSQLCPFLEVMHVPGISKYDPTKWGKSLWMTSIKTMMNMYHLNYKNMEYISWHREKKPSLDICLLYCGWNIFKSKAQELHIHPYFSFLPLPYNIKQGRDDKCF